jgi:hypothetical protein
MANEIDMWNDIEKLERSPKYKKQADLMLGVYTAYFMEGDSKKANVLINKAKKKFPKFPFDFHGYGIPHAQRKLRKVI